MFIKTFLYMEFARIILESYRVSQTKVEKEEENKIKKLCITTENV